MLKRILALTFLVCPAILFAQLQNPSSLRWVIVKTPHFKVIAPTGIRNQAIETANTLEYVYKPVSSTLFYPKKKLPLLLLNQTAVSNGYVSLAPIHAAFYTTPMQDANIIGGADWIQSLSLHEYRHYVQFEKLDDHTTNLAKGIFGDYGMAFLINWSVPFWMFEGDAICSETTLSAGGRGRLSAFSRDIRANELENIRYRYDKAYLGSYRNYIPNHYYLGYTLCSGIKSNYGLETWDKIMTRSSKVSVWPYGFTRSVKTHTRKSINNNYKAVLEEYKNIWKEKSEIQTITEFKTLYTDKKKFTDYTYPFIMADGSVICVKSGMADAPQLCRLTGNTEEKMPGINPMDRVHSNGKKIVWSIIVPDLRWGERTFSDIIVYDIGTGKRKKITNRMKYFAPAISPKGDLIAAVEYTDDMKCALVLIDALSGRLVEKYNIDNNNYIRMPSFSANGDKIVFTETQGQEIAVTVFDIAAKTFSKLIPFGFENITSPIFFDNYVLYNTPGMGVDAIFAIDINTREQFMVAAGKYGVYNASITGNKITFQNYTTNGFDVAIAELLPKQWYAKETLQNVHDNYYMKLLNLERRGNIFKDSVTDNSKNYKVKNYFPALHSLKIHSSTPKIVSNGIGLAVFSNDYLNTTELKAEIDYYPRDRATRQYINLIYSRFYPVFKAEISNGRNYLSGIDNVNKNLPFGLNENSARIEMGLPLNFSKEIWASDILFNTGFTFLFQQYDSLPNNYSNNKINFSALHVGLIFNNYRISSLRNINPDFGQTIRANSWFTTQAEEKRISVNGVFYFPGFFKHHSFSVEAAYERNINDFRYGIYTLETDIEFARGYDKPLNCEKYYNAAFIYTLPLLCPDLALGPILYLKRVHAGFFYNYGKIILNGYSPNYTSTGIDLNFEVNFLRLIFPIELGLRYSYLPEAGKSRVEFLLFRQLTH